MADSMYQLPRKALRTYRPRYLRPVIGGVDERQRSHPTPASMFSRIGAIILIALCVGLAADFLVTAMTH